MKITVVLHVLRGTCAGVCPRRQLRATDVCMVFMIVVIFKLQRFLRGAFHSLVCVRMGVFACMHGQIREEHPRKKYFELN